jgi:hypothetical protein
MTRMLRHSNQPSPSHDETKRGMVAFFLLASGRRKGWPLHAWPVTSSRPVQSAGKVKA